MFPGNEEMFKNFYMQNKEILNQIQNEIFDSKILTLFEEKIQIKYKKVSFSNPGHAHNLAKKLNEMFKSEDFAVYKLTQGELVSDE